jgi:NADH:ubiquinone oxidoreductase subunit K
MTAFSFILVFIFQFMYDPNIRRMIDKVSQNVDPNIFYCIMIVIYAVIIAVFIGLIWLFYRVLYGILMRRLQKNYIELKKIDY